MTSVTTSMPALRAAVQRTGYYPDLVMDSLLMGIGDQPVTSFLVHHEATFDQDELFRHITAMALTPKVLVVTHVDESPFEDSAHKPAAMASTQTVRIDQLRPLVINQVVADPTGATADQVPIEVDLTMGWGMTFRVDIQPAQCPDPSCEADHGYTGQTGGEDYRVRVTAADGEDVLRQALEFGKTLAAAIAAV